MEHCPSRFVLGTGTPRRGAILRSPAPRSGSTNWNHAGCRLHSGGLRSVYRYRRGPGVAIWSVSAGGTQIHKRPAQLRPPAYGCGATRTISSRNYSGVGPGNADILQASLAAPIISSVTYTCNRTYRTKSILLISLGRESTKRAGSTSTRPPMRLPVGIVWLSLASRTKAGPAGSCPGQCCVQALNRGTEVENSATNQPTVREKIKRNVPITNTSTVVSFKSPLFLLLFRN